MADARNIEMVRELSGLSEAVRVVYETNGLQRVVRFSGEDSPLEARRFCQWKFGEIPPMRDLKIGD